MYSCRQLRNKTIKSTSFCCNLCFSCRKCDGLFRGSEHLDHTKHLIFWLCNMKQLNFRHFNTNRKKFTVTVNFGQKETKTAPKRPILFCLVYQEVFSHFPTIPDHLRRFPKIPEKKSENFRLYFVVIFTCERCIFNAVKCNLTELTTRSACSIPGRRCVRDAHVPRSVMLWDQCASYRGLVHLAFSHFWCVRQLFSVLYSAWAYHKRCDSVHKRFLPSPFPLMFSV